MKRVFNGISCRLSVGDIVLSATCGAFVGSLFFVDLIPCFGWVICPRIVSCASGQYRAIRFGVSPGHVLYAPRFTAAYHVVLTGYPAQACR